MDIYDAHNPRFTRQPDVTLMKDENAPQGGTLHMDTYPRPEMLVDVFSEGSAQEDHNEKVEIYLDWDIPHYLILDPVQNRIRIIDKLGRDESYPPSQKRIRIHDSLEILWDGNQEDFQACWKGEKLLVPEGYKAMIKEKDQKILNHEELISTQSQSLSQEKAKAELFAKKLQELGVDPNSLLSK